LQNRKIVFVAQSLMNTIWNCCQGQSKVMRQVATYLPVETRF